MIEKLEMFMALAKAQHFGRAAQECGVTQPTLSAAIKQLEAQLGVMLVLRDSRFQRLTPEGERVLVWARQIVGDARIMQAEMRASTGGLSGRLRIGVIPTALAMVADLTEPLSAEHPNIDFAILSRTSDDIAHLLDTLELDAGITYLGENTSGRLAEVPLYTESYQLVTSRGEMFAKSKQVSWAEVSVLRLCLLTEKMQNRRIINQHMATAGISVQPGLESDSMIALLSHVRTGKWSSIMPTKLIETIGLGEDLLAVPIGDADAAHRVGLVTRAFVPDTPLISALRAQARIVGDAE